MRSVLGWMLVFAVITSSAAQATTCQTRIKLAISEDRLDELSLKELLQCAIENASQAEGKDLIVFLGATGSGKSTTINFLKGTSLVLRCDDDGQCNIYPDSSENDDTADIGHTLISETFLPDLFYNQTSDFYFADLPGFHGNRGKNFEIAELVASKLLLDLSHRVKFVLCVDYNMFDVARGDPLRSAIKQFLGGLLKDYAVHPNSIILLVTHAKDKLSGRPISEQAIFKKLVAFRDQAKDPEEKTRFAFLTRDIKFVKACAQVWDITVPSVQQSRNELSEVLKTLVWIDNVRDKIQMPYSDSVRSALFEDFSAISSNGKDVLENYFRGFENLERLCQEHDLPCSGPGAIIEERLNAHIDRIAQNCATISELYANIIWLSERADQEQEIGIISERIQFLQESNAMSQRMIDLNRKKHQGIRGLETGIAKLVAEIGSLRADFEYVQDFLTLTSDKLLSQLPVISGFLKQYEKFKALKT